MCLTDTGSHTAAPPRPPRRRRLAVGATTGLSSRHEVARLTCDDERGRETWTVESDTRVRETSGKRSVCACPLTGAVGFYPLKKTSE